MNLIPYPRLVFKPGSDDGVVVHSVDELAAKHADGYIARPLPTDGPELAEYYEPKKRRGRPPLTDAAVAGAKERIAEG